ncbi:MAG: histidine phosphatase family protein [bacterium]
MEKGSVMRIIIVRHGETAWNLEEVFRGRKDVPLNETGERQVEKLGAALKGEEISVVYSSPLSRSMATSRAVAHARGVEIVQSPELVDISYGEWEGMSNKEVEERHPDVMRRWKQAPGEVKFPGGESLDEVRRRAVGFLEDVLKRHRGQTVVLSTHRVVCKVLVLHCLGLDNSRFWNVRQETAAYSVFDYEDSRFILVRHNEACHLKGIRDSFLSDF